MFPSSVQQIDERKLMIFSGSANEELGQEIARNLGLKMGKVLLKTFSNGEIYCKYLESVRGANVFVIQSISPPVNFHLMQLLIMIDALKRASAEKIAAVIPYYGYSRQDKKTEAREPISAKLVADLLTVAGLNRVLTMDLHAGQIQGFFDLPVDHLTALPLLADYFISKDLKDLVIVSPDVGRVKTAKKFSDKLKAPLAILHKARPEHSVAEVLNVIGEVKGKVALLIDDMIDTAGTITEAAKTLVEKEGCKEVYAACTHPILSGPAIDRINDSPLVQVVVTDTISLPEGKDMKKFKALSVAPILADTVRNVFEEESVSELFEGDNQLF